jgi:hypothetical protein
MDPITPMPIRTESETEWRKPPPGTVIVTSGLVQQGDWFYIEELGAWGLVPEIGWGEPIIFALIARGVLDESSVIAL